MGFVGFPVAESVFFFLFTGSGRLVVAFGQVILIWLLDGYVYVVF